MVDCIVLDAVVVAPVRGGVGISSSCVFLSGEGELLDSEGHEQVSGLYGSLTGVDPDGDDTMSILMVSVLDGVVGVGDVEDARRIGDHGDVVAAAVAARDRCMSSDSDSESDVCFANAGWSARGNGGDGSAPMIVRCRTCRDDVVESVDERRFRVVDDDAAADDDAATVAPCCRRRGGEDDSYSSSSSSLCRTSPDCAAVRNSSYAPYSRP